MCEVYNAGLQERRDEYRTAGHTVWLFDQYNQVKDLNGRYDGRSGAPIHETLPGRGQHRNYASRPPGNG